MQHCENVIDSIASLLADVKQSGPWSQLENDRVKKQIRPLASLLPKLQTRLGWMRVCVGPAGYRVVQLY